jgi:hypothetical protein
VALRTTARTTADGKNIRINAQRFTEVIYPARANACPIVGMATCFSRRPATRSSPCRAPTRRTAHEGLDGHESSCPQQ